MSLDGHGLLAAALALRVTADTTGLEAELGSKLTAAERRAELTATKVSASAGKVAESGAVASSKLEVATLRQTAAQETYNRLLRAGETDTVRLARAQASLITAQRGVATEQARLNSAASVPLRRSGTLGVLSGAAGVAGFLAVSAALRTGVQELSDYQAGFAQAEQGIRTTGGAANVTADDVEKLAARIQEYSGYTDDAVVASEDLLLTFPKVRNEVGAGNDVFDRATVAAADLARRGFGDLSTNAKALGKALSDPVAGLTALRRSGVTFTDQQKETIEGLVKSNRLLDAQRIVLDEVNREVGGSAKAYGETLPGQVDRSRRAFEDLSQGIVADLEPALRAAADVTTFLAGHQGIVKVGLGLGALAGGVVLASKAVKAYRDVVDTLFTRTAARVAANTAVAASYDAIAVSAGAAARAEGAAATVDAGGVLGEMAALRSTIPAAVAGGGIIGSRGAGLLGRGSLLLGGLGRAAAVAATVVDPALLAALFAGPGGGNLSDQDKSDEARFNQLISSVTYRNGDYYVGDVRLTGAALARVKRLAPFIKGAPASDQYTKVPGEPTGGFTYGQNAQFLSSIVGRVAAGGTTQQRTTAAVQQFTEAGANYAASVDIFSRAAPLHPRAAPSARQALVDARIRAADAARAVNLDEQRLNELRSTGKASTLQLASAEETLRKAKERSAKASDEVRDAEKNAHAPRLATAQSLLKTLTSQENRAAQDATAVERLYAAGLNPNVVKKVLAQNAQRPGTLESVAKTITPGLAKSMNAEFHRLRFDGSIITGTPRDWRKAGQNRALDFIAGVKAEFNDADLSIPLRRTRLNLGRTGRTGSYDPSSVDDRGRVRQRALSGSPSVPHGA